MVASTIAPDIPQTMGRETRDIAIAMILDLEALVARDAPHFGHVELSRILHQPIADEQFGHFKEIATTIHPN
jgi:hypothetical protein